MSAPARARVVADATPDEPIDAFVEWMRGRELSENTVRVFRSVLVSLGTFMGRPLTEAAEADLLRWRQFACKGRTRNTEKTYVAAVRSFYRWAEAAGRTSGNPSAHLRARTWAELGQEERDLREVEMDEVEEFFRRHPEAGLGQGAGAVRLPCCPTCGRVNDRVLDRLLLARR